MSSAFDTPASIGSEFAELKRRIRVLETAARVPTISTAALGVQAASVASVSVPGLTDTYAAVAGGASLTVRVSPSGRLLLLLADDAVCEAGAGSTGWYASLALSGANTAAASDAYALRHFADGTRRSTYFTVLDGLQPGDTTFTTHARHTGVAPTTASFRSMTVVAMPL